MSYTPALEAALALHPAHTEALTTHLTQNARMLSGALWDDYVEGFVERLTEDDAAALPALAGKFHPWIAGYAQAAWVLTPPVPAA